MEICFYALLDVLPFTYGSIKGNRKASCDVKSLCSEGKKDENRVVNHYFDGLYPAVGLGRRQSFAKFHAMTIEAPITKVYVHQFTNTNSITVNVMSTSLPASVLLHQYCCITTSPSLPLHHYLSITIPPSLLLHQHSCNTSLS